MTTIFVCVTCRREGEALDPPEGRSGYRFHEALIEAMPAAAGIELRPVACLSNCSRGCNVAFAAPGKWAFVVGGLDPARHLPDVLTFSAQHRSHAEGLPAWRDRPECVRKGVAARIPPFGADAPGEERCTR